RGEPGGPPGRLRRRGRGIQVVELASVVRFHVVGVESVGSEVAVRPGRFASQAVDGAVACGRDDPAAGVRGHSVLRPLLGRDGEGFGHRVLGEIDVAEDTDQRGGAPAGFSAEDGIEGFIHPSAGRTSTGPSQAAAALPAHASAASRSGASIIQKPPICSFVSAYGPSVIDTSPPVDRTTVAEDAGWSPAPNTQAPARSSSPLNSPTCATWRCASGEEKSRS